MFINNTPCYIKLQSDKAYEYFPLVLWVGDWILETYQIFKFQCSENK